MDFLEAPARQAAVVEATGHRPWPLPERPWTQAQTWEDLSFFHWRVDEASLRPLVPDGLELDTFDGAAWLGVVPFRVTGLRLRGLPPAPVVSAYAQLNVRTYVTAGGRAGVWFFGLEASSRLAAEAARRLYRLPFRHARIAVERDDGLVRIESSRPGAVFSAHCCGEGEPFTPEPGSLEHFLVERYCLYVGGDGPLRRAEIHHPPWSLRRAEAAVELNTLAPDGVTLPEDPPLAYAAARQDAVVWGLEPVAPADRDRL